MIERAVLRGWLVGLGAVAAMFGLGCTDGVSAYDALVSEAESARQLQLLQGLPIEEISSEDYAAQQQASAADIDEAQLEEYRATYGRLGYFDASLDLKTTFAGAGSWVAGTYNSLTNQILIIGDPGDDVIVHEMVHGLQDQHFDLWKFRSAPATTDGFFARRAVIEGDATLAQNRYLLRSKSGVDLDQVDYAKWLPALRESSAKYLAENPYPAIFRAAPAFLYSHGTIFCAHNLTGASPAAPSPAERAPFDWGREDRLFREPPATTEQILKLAATGESVEIGLDHVPKGLRDDLKAIDWDVLGAWHAALLFYDTLGLDPALDLASHWEGDRVLFVKDHTTLEYGVVWASAWDDASSKDTAESALKTLHGFTEVEGGEPAEGTAADGEALWIEARGQRLVFLKNVRKELAPALVDAAIGPETKPLSTKAGAPLAGIPRSRPSLAAWIYRHMGGHL